MTLLFLQIITGICLCGSVYVPSADQAYESLLYLNYQQACGWFLRALHYWAASAMVLMVVVHMTQVFLYGAFQYPRELTWVVGVFLLILTLAMSFTGQVLRWDPDAYWGIGVGAAMAGRMPGVGGALVRLLLGGLTIRARLAQPFFYFARVRHPGAAANLPRDSSLARLQVRNQRSRPKPVRKSTLAPTMRMYAKN